MDASSDDLAAVFSSPFPELETPRVRLRAFTEADADALLELRSSAAVARFIHRPLLTEESRAAELACASAKLFADGAGIAWAGEMKVNGRRGGALGFRRLEKENLRAELGGEMVPQFWGRGLAGEAIDAVLGFGFGQMGLHAVEAWVDPANRGAIHWMQRAGFVEEGVFRERMRADDGYHDLAIWTCFADRWRPTLAGAG